jgi:glycosyltransferase involved in cell wall biosynthesis
MAHPLNEPQRFSAHFPSRVDLDPAPRSLGARVRVAGRMLWSRESERGMVRVLDAFRPDVVHLHNVYHQLSPSVLRPVRAAGIPSVMTLHDYKLACPQYTCLDHGRICEACVGGRFWNAPLHACKDGSRAASGLLALESWAHHVSGAYDAVDLFLAPSRFLASVVERAGIDPSRLRHLDNLVDVRSVPARVGAGDGVVCVARLSEEKGIDVLLRAMALLPHGEVTGVGDGPARPELESLAREVVPGRATFTGRLDRAGVLAALRASRVAVLPARWNENQPIAILEAFASSVPVVASDVGGLPEVVRPGEDGALVPMEDPAALALVLAEYLADPERSVREGAAARRRAERNHDADIHLARLRSLYAEAAERHEPVRAA